MPISFKQNIEKNFIVITASEHIVAEDILNAQQFFFTNLHVRKGYRLLIDGRFAYADEIGVSLIQQMLELEKNYPELLQDAKVAYVVSDDFVQKIATLYASSTQVNTIVFITLDIALKFLGIEKSVLDNASPII